MSGPSARARGNEDRPAAPADVDSRGQRCPLPVIALARALTGMPAGGTVRLLATDPAARVDIPAFCRLRGAELVEVSEQEDPAGRYTAYVVRSVSASTSAAEPAEPPRASRDTPGAAPR